MKQEKIDIDPVVEVTTSFSYKHYDGTYNSRDFFCAQKAECLESDKEKVYEKIHEFCKQMVLKSLNQWKKERFEETNQKSLKLEKNDKFFEVRDEVEENH